MALSTIQTSFAGGEISPKLYARVDLDKFEVGAALVRNFYVDYRGGVANRPGTRFVYDFTEKLNGEQYSPFLVEFIVSQDASYVLAFIEEKILIFLRGIYLADSDVVTPYAREDLFDLKFAQSADVLTITHPSYPPANLTREDDTTFTYEVISVGARILPPVVTGMSAPTTGTFNYGYVVTAVSLDGKEESRISNLAVIHSDIQDDTTNVVVSLQWTAPSDPVSKYNIYKWGPQSVADFPPASVWGFIGSSQSTSFVDLNIAQNFGQQPPTPGDPFSGGQITSITVTAGGSGYVGTNDWPNLPYVPLDITGDGSGAFGWALIDPAAGTIVSAFLTYPGQGYTTATITADGEGGTGATFSATFSDIRPLNPACVSYLQQRRVFAGSNLQPETFVCSQPGKFNNFDTTPSSLATDAISATVAAQEVNTIRSLVPVSYGLLAFTSGGTFLINGGGPNAEVSPSTISVTSQASPGANGLQPLTVNYDVLYGQAKGNRLRNASYAWERQSYTVGDFTQLAPHLFDTYVTTDWAWAEEPFKLLYTVRNDGRLLTCTYVPEQQVYAWARHDTQGLFTSVCSVPEDQINAVYVVVNRHIPNEDGSSCWKYYLERFPRRQGCCIYNARFLDSHVELNREVQDIPIWLTAGTEPDTVNVYSYDPCTNPADPPGPFGTTEGGFVASADNTPAGGITYPLQTKNTNLDQYGHCWGFSYYGNNYYHCFDQTGTKVKNGLIGDLVDQVATFMGWPTGGSQFGQGAVVKDGATTYMLLGGTFYGAGGAFDVYEYIAVMDIASNGDLTVLGCAYTNPGFGVLATFPQSGPNCLSLGGAKTFDDPIFAWWNPADTLGAGATWAKFYPSVNAIIAAGTGKFNSIRYPPTPNTISTDDYYNYGLNAQPFCLPGPGGTTRAYLYVPKKTMVDNSGMSPSCPFYGTSYAGFPDGMMTYVDYGVVVAPTIVASGGTATSSDDTSTAPVADAGCFDFGTGSVDAFPDTGEFIDGSTGANSEFNDYFWSPAVYQGDGGSFETLWVQPYQFDPTYTTGDSTIFVRIRRMTFDGGPFTQIEEVAQGTATLTDIGGVDTTNNAIQILDIQAGISATGQIEVWFTDGFTINYTGRLRVWLWRTAKSASIVEGDVIHIDCGKLQVLEIVSPSQIIAQVIAPLDLTLPDDPDGTYVPVEAGGWTVVTPAQIIPNLDHLEGKEVWALADGNVVGPLTVVGGEVDIGEVASSVVVGLKYTQQLKTLYLTADGLNQGTEQGKRKMIPSVTLRLDCTKGIEVGPDFDYLTPVQDAVLNEDSSALFSGDAYTPVFTDWNTKGEICVEQDKPYPVAVLGVIVNVVPGDTGR